MPTVNFGGLASGLDTQALIKAIMDFERQPLDRLESRVALFNQQKSALNELTSKLNTFESALRDLSSITNFRGRTSSVSDETVLRATPGSGAEIGLFQVEVNVLAEASKVKSDGFTESDQALVADGTITLQAGSNDEIVIDVSAAAGNNTLEQVRDSVNAADAGVQAAIIFDGTAYRLTLRSEETGTANALTISDGTDLNLEAAENSVGTAADAELTIDGIDVTASSNTVTGVIPGVTLDLISTTETDLPITIEITQDADRVVENTEELVKTYNEVLSFLNGQFNRDNPGPLATDSTARSVQLRLQSLLTSGVDGIPFGDIRSLGSIGVEFDGKTGEASLDSGKLRELLDTDFDAVGNLFLSSGRATDPRIQFLAASSDTVAGTYDVTITQAAEKALVSGSTAIAALSGDETLTISDGVDSIDIVLAASTPVDQIAATLNEALAASDVDATAQLVGGVLQFVSSGYGSGATISARSDRADAGNGQSTGIGTTELTDTGLDVAGTIAGVEATGTGQVLTAAEGDDSAGLQLRVTATAATVAALGGDFGTLSFSRGLIPSVLTEVDQFTRLGDGPLDRAGELLDNRLKQLNNDIERFEERLTLREARLARAFVAAERAIQSLQAQQAQFGAI